MALLNDILSLLAISPLFIIACVFAINYKTRLGRLISLLCFLLIAYLAANFQYIQVGNIADLIFGLMSIFIPAVLWFFAFYLFCDNEKVKLHIWLIVVGGLVLKISGTLVYSQEMGTQVLYYLLLYTVPLITALGLSLHVLYLAMRDYGIDLIEHRRKARVIFVACIAVLIFIIVGYSLISQVGRLRDPRLEVLQTPMIRAFFTFYIFTFSFGFSLAAFQLRHQLRSLVTKSTEVRSRSNIRLQILSESDRALINLVKAKMETDRAYAITGITITSFAKLLCIQEYRLRKLINRNLQYRNFNQLLNHYRIREASTRLKETNDSISRIALEVGYASISPFNAAFKSHYGKTPTEFRLSD